MNTPHLINGKTPPGQPSVTTTITINPQKIARDSLIHKNDVFQFDDVDSIHTNDVFFKLTPQSSSLESESTYQSHSISKSSNINTNNNNNSGSHKKKKSKKLKKAKQSFANFITPIIRGVTNQDSKKSLKPESISSVASTPNMESPSINKKYNTLNVVNGHAACETASQTNDSAKTVFKKESSVERSYTFTKKLNSFKSLINSRNKNNSSSTNVSKIAENKQENSNNNSNKNDSNEIDNSNAINNDDAANFEKFNNLYVNSSCSPNKQLTINSSMNKYLNKSNQENDKDLEISNISKSTDIISIPVSTTSIASFTVKNRANIDDKENGKNNGLTNEGENVTNSNIITNGNHNLKEPPNELVVNRSSSLKIKSKSKLFDKFKLSSNSNDKISNGSTKKK